MKAVVVGLALLVGSLAQAAESQGSISCSVDSTAGDGTTLKFESRLLLISKTADGKTSATVWDPVATLTDSYSTPANEPQVGRAQTLSADANYKPRKYKDTVRFDLSNLIDTSNFGAYLPSDMCSIKIMIPTNAIELGKFKAAAIINCDQSGGSKTMDCTAVKRTN